MIGIYTFHAANKQVKQDIKDSLEKTMRHMSNRVETYLNSNDYNTAMQLIKTMEMLAEEIAEFTKEEELV